MMEIYKLAEENGFVDIIEKIIKLRNSFVRLGRTDFMKDVKNGNYDYQEKSGLVLEVFKEILQDDPPQPDQDGDGDDEDSEQDNQNNEGDEDSEDEQNEQNKKESDKQRTSEQMDKMNDLIERLANTLEVAYESSPEATPDKFVESNSIRQLLQVQNWDVLLKLICTYKHFLDGKDSNEEIPAFIGQKKFKKMHSYSDIKYVQMKDWMLPDEILDLKLAKKDLIVNRPIIKKKNFNVFILADKSGSMNSDFKAVFLRSLLIAFGKKALEMKSELTVQFFDGLVKKPIVLTTWSSYMLQVLKMEMDGSTDIESAIKSAYNLMTDEELVVITDGTVARFPPVPEHLKDRKKNCVVLHDGGEDLSTFRQYFTKVIENKAKSLKEAEQAGFDLIDAF
jgi:uncharacterized protein with von Willebrand factor type A (vWA) domain